MYNLAKETSDKLFKQATPYLKKGAAVLKDAERQFVNTTKAALDKANEYLNKVKDKGERVLFFFQDTLMDFKDQEKKLKYLKKVGKKVKEYFNDKLKDAKKLAESAKKEVRNINI